MQLGIFAKTFPGADPATVLAAVRDAGFATSQFNMACCGLPSMPDEIDAATIGAIRAAQGSTGVANIAMSGTFNMIHPDPGVRATGLRRLRVLAEASRALGIRIVTLCTGTRDEEDQWRHHPDNVTPEAWHDLLAGMEAAVEIAERHEVVLGIEPELANVVASAAKAKQLLDDIDSDRLGIVLDPANLFEVASLEEQRRLGSDAIELLGDRIVMGHAKDRTPDGGFTTAGQGVLDYAHYLTALKATGFDGPLVTHGLSAAEAPGVARFLTQALAAA
jgi:sugar phosphate isomerase/epimerase